MARNLTASDRSRLIKLARTLPTGSPERKAILAGLATRSKEASMSLADLKIELLEELDTFRDGEIEEGRTIAVEAPDGHVYGVYHTGGMTRKEVEAEINAARSLRDLDDPDMQPGAWSRRSAGLMDSVSRGNFKKDALAALPSLKDEVEAVKAFAEAQVASWDSSADATDEETSAEDLEAWFNELDMAVDAIKAWKRNLMKALK